MGLGSSVAYDAAQLLKSDLENFNNKLKEGISEVELFRQSTDKNVLLFLNKIDQTLLFLEDKSDSLIIELSYIKNDLVYVAYFVQISILVIMLFQFNIRVMRRGQHAQLKSQASQCPMKKPKTAFFEKLRANILLMSDMSYILLIFLILINWVIYCKSPDIETFFAISNAFTVFFFAFTVFVISLNLLSLLRLCGFLSILISTCFTILLLYFLFNIRSNSFFDAIFRPETIPPAKALCTQKGFVFLSDGCYVASVSKNSHTGSYAECNNVMSLLPQLKNQTNMKNAVQMAHYFKLEKFWVYF